MLAGGRLQVGINPGVPLHCKKIYLCFTDIIKSKRNVRKKEGKQAYR